VVPTNPTEAIMNAAIQLQTSLQTIAGQSFVIAPEDRVKSLDGTFTHQGKAFSCAIWIGSTKRSAETGLDVQNLRADGFCIRITDCSVFLVGKDASPPAKVHRGTSNAVAHFLENYLGVRWLWPGELGTVLPSRTSLTIEAQDMRNEPAILQRKIRNMKVNDRSVLALNILDLPDGTKIYEKTLAETTVWLARQGTGTSLRLDYQHAFEDWYVRYGMEHPDWFALQRNGSRVQEKGRPRLCKSNPEVAHQAALQALEYYEKNPTIDCAPISPNDGGNNSFCMCEECRKLDPPNGEKIKMIFFDQNGRSEEDYPSLSDRVAVFYNRIAENVVKVKPDAKLGAYAYSAYRDAPLNTPFHPAIMIGFVGFSYFNDVEHQRDMRRWNNLCGKATEIFLRPNTFHVGESLPAVYVHRMAADVRHCFETGMTAADFDSILGNWSTQGLNYYVLAKLLWNPFADVDEVVSDYCEAGFGKGAGKIKTYFDLLGEATARVAALNGTFEERQLRDEEQNMISNIVLVRMTAFRKAYCEAFSPEFIEQLRGVLDEAKLEAADPVVARRIAFLALGLEYAQLKTQLFRALMNGDEALKERQAVLDWYRSMFQNEPLAVSPVNRLFRDRAMYQAIK